MSDTTIDPRSQSHPDHPTLAHKIWFWVIDGMMDGLPDDHDWTDEDEELGNAVEITVKAMLCARFGHEVEDDQCNRPEHRYCQWCNAPMPDMPLGRVAVTYLASPRMPLALLGETGT